MPKYFVGANGRLDGEVLCDEPVNPDGLRIVESSAVSGDCNDYMFSDESVVFSPIAKTLEQQIAALESALDDHLDSVAQQYRFSDCTRLALRAGYPNAWQQLGIAFGSWMDQCNALVAAGLQEVISGTRELPTKEAMIADLPVFVAP